MVRSACNSVSSHVTAISRRLHVRTSQPIDGARILLQSFEAICEATCCRFQRPVSHRKRIAYPGRVALAYRNLVHRLPFLDTGDP